MSDDDENTKALPSLYIADHEEHARVRHVMAEHHDDLAEAGVTVTVLFSRVQLKLHGATAYATIKITPPNGRALGVADALITLDHRTWMDHSEETRDAIIDHELTHLSLKVASDEDPTPKLDAYDRPKLKMRPHDHRFGWFSDVAARHGEASIERQQAAQLAEEGGQIYWLAALRPESLAATGTDGRAARAKTERPSLTLASATESVTPEDMPKIAEMAKKLRGSPRGKGART